MAQEEVKAAADNLSAVPSTLRIPLAARALGHTLFPQHGVDDRFAAQALNALGDEGQQWLRDRHSIYGTLARTRCFRSQAKAFLARHPGAHVVNLGCGLAHYVQWLDDGHMRMTDADLPEVLALRRQLLPWELERYALREVDLNDTRWWDSLELPATREEQALFLFSEGVFMYLQPQTVSSVLQTFGERAPAGSVLAFDAMCWLAAGRARQHPSVRHTDAQFHWGPRRIADIASAHPRLQLLAAHQVMESYGLPYSVMVPAFRFLTGVPFYAVYCLGIRD